MKPALKTKTGRLTRYGLTCGYIETAQSDDGQRSAKLWMEHGVFFVGYYDRDIHHDGWRRVRGWDRLTAARARLDQGFAGDDA